MFVKVGERLISDAGNERVDSCCARLVDSAWPLLRLKLTPAGNSQRDSRELERQH
jgi:hypothetical protein